MVRDLVALALAGLWVLTLGAVVAALVNVGLKDPVAASLCASSLIMWAMAGHALHARLERLPDECSGMKDHERLLGKDLP